MKYYEVSANGHFFGVYQADSKQSALELCAIDAGYKSIQDMVNRLETASELIATEV